MSVTLLMNLLNELNKSILCMILTSIIICMIPDKHNIIIFNEFSKFSTEPTQTYLSP